MENTRERTILFLATREPSYSRVKLTAQALSAHAHVISLTSSRRSYPLRMAAVLLRYLMTRIRTRHIDCVYVGFLAQSIVPLIRATWRGRLLSDVYISLYDTICFDRRYASPGSVIGRLAYYLDDMTLRYSDYIMTDTREHADYLADTFGISKKKIGVILISADTDVFYPQPELKPPTAPFQVCFYGTYIPLQGADIIARAAHLLRHEPIQFTMIGSGQTFAEVAAFVREHHLRNVVLARRRPLQAVALQVAQSHVGLGIFGRTDKTQRVIPNKATEILAMKRFLLTGDTPAVRELLQHGHNAYLCEVGSPEALAEGIRWAMKHPTEREAIAAQGYETFLARASPAVITRQVVEELKHLD